MSKRTLKDYYPPVPVVREFEMRKSMELVEYTPLRMIDKVVLYIDKEKVPSFMLALANSTYPILKQVHDEIEGQSMCLDSKDTECIPNGMYCHSSKKDDHYTCPYWAIAEDMPYQMDGYCKFLERGDWQLGPHSLLWDKCKVCGVNMEDDFE